MSATYAKSVSDKLGKAQVVQEPSELDGEGSPEVGVGGPRTMREGHDLRDETGPSMLLQGIDEWKDTGEAGKLFQNGCAWLHAMRKQTWESFEPMARAAWMVEGQLEGIFAHWTQRLTTAFMEGLNSLFSAVKRKACGYRTVEYMTATLYLAARKLSLACC
jgi:hypothetical protein